MSAGLCWTVAGMGDWFYWSTYVHPKHEQGQSEWYSMIALSRPIFLSIPAFGALKETLY